jgi:hypothetical protein
MHFDEDSSREKFLMKSTWKLVLAACLGFFVICRAYLLSAFGWRKIYCSSGRKISRDCEPSFRELPN